MHNLGSPGNIFVGRHTEQTAFQTALDSVLEGHGQLMLLVGAPGIGKTRTAQEMTSYAESRGVQVLWGRCYEGDGAPPYWPWIQPLRYYAQSAHPDELAATMGPGAADIAEIVSEVRDILPDLSRPPEMEPEQARFRVFNSIARFLCSASQVKPLMIVLDDLHWADTASLQLLEFVAQEIGTCPILLLGTYRDVEVSRNHPLAQTLGKLVREGRFMRMNLPGLSSSEVAELVSLTSGEGPSNSLVDAIYERTEGNPFYVNEVVRVLDQEGFQQGMDGGPDRPISVPDGVRETISRRLNRLSDNCHQALATASVIGREFDFGLLHSLTGDITENQLLEVIDESLETHLIEEVPGERDRYQFSHALIQDTLSGELSSSRKVRIHGRIGETLERLYEGNVEANAAVIAHHFSEARLVTGNEKVVQYCLLAGEQALAGYAHEEALQQFQRAVDATEGRPMDAQIAAILGGLGRAQAATFERHRIREVMATLSRAIDYFAQAGDVDRVVSIAEYPFYPLLGQSTGNARLLASALALVQPESPAAGRLLSRYGRVMGLEESDYETAKQAFAQALEIAHRDRNATLEMQALAESANVEMIYGRYKECLEQSERAIQLSDQVDDPQAEALARYSAVLANIALGNLAEVRPQSSKLLESAEKLRDRFWFTVAFRSHEDEAHLVGDWTTARNYSDRGLAMSPAECRNLCTRALLEYQTGESTEGESYLRRLVEVVNQTPAGATLEHSHAALAIPLAAHISGDDRFLEAAAAAGAAVMGTSPRIGYMDLAARCGLAVLGALRQDAGSAQEHYPSLLPLRSRMVLFGMITTDRVLGLLARTMGDLDRSATHFDEGLSFCRGAGYRPELAWVCSDYADTLLQRNVSGDRHKARSLLEEARSIADGLGMTPLLERCQGRLDSLLASPAPASIYPAGLSQREVEVLRLIAAGKSNREIAADLFISLNTVANHVRNILNKTGANNRTEAAGFAIRFDLTSN